MAHSRFGNVVLASVLGMVLKALANQHASHDDFAKLTAATTGLQTSASMLSAGFKTVQAS